MKQCKKILSVVIVCIMAVSFLQTVAFSEGSELVYLTVENLTYSEEGAVWTGKLLDCAEIEITEDESKLSDVILKGLEAAGYTQNGAESGYITDINGLGELAGSSEGGWRVSLNDWVISAGINEFYVSDGDLISLMYTSVGFGEDIGSSWSNNNKKLKEIAFSEGELSEEFSQDVYEYVLRLPSEVESIKITPTAENKNFQTRIYLNTEFSEGDNGKFIEGEKEVEAILCGLEAWQPIPESICFYKRTQKIPVENGSVISVACGLDYWSSMNNGEFGCGAENEPGSVYTFTVEKEEAEIKVSAGIYDHTAVTYKAENRECDALVSENGVLFETEEFSVKEGTCLLDALEEIFKAAELSYELDANGTYVTKAGMLSEMDCTGQSGWMVSVNDKFPTESAKDVIVNDGDNIKLHYSVYGWGTDIGNYFSGGPALRKLKLGDSDIIISENTVYEDENDWIGTTQYYLGEYVENGNNIRLEGDGSIENPFIIPVTVSDYEDIKALNAQLETSLHKNYLSISEGEGLCDIFSELSYEAPVTFGIETIGGFYKTFYTIEVTKDSSSEGNTEEEEENPEEKEELPKKNHSSGDGVSSIKKVSENDKKEEPEINEEPKAFEDTSGHWAEGYITRLSKRGIIKGKTEKSFAPDDNITRAELVSLLYRMSGEKNSAADEKFSDVNKNDWFSDAVSWATEKGIAYGMTESEFKPYELVNREQSAVFIVRFCEIMNYGFEAEAEGIEFCDSVNISDWAENSVIKAQLYGIINGFEDGSFRPEDLLTRAQTAKILCSIPDNSEKE